MRWLIALGVLAVAAPPLLGWLYLRSVAGKVSRKATTPGGDFRKRLFRGILR